MSNYFTYSVAVWEEGSLIDQSSCKGNFLHFFLHLNNRRVANCSPSFFFFFHGSMVLMFFREGFLMTQ